MLQNPGVQNEVRSMNSVLTVNSVHSLLSRASSLSSASARRRTMAEAAAAKEKHSLIGLSPKERTKGNYSKLRKNFASNKDAPNTT